MNTDKKLNSYKTAAIAAIALTAILGIVAFCFCTEGSSKYFNNPLVASLLYATIAVDVILALAAYFLFQKADPVQSEVPAKLQFLSLITALPAAFIYVTLGKQIFSEGFNVWIAIIFITTLLSQLYQLAGFFKLGQTGTLAWGLFHIAFCIVVIAKIYLDFSVEMNAPLKLIIQFTAAASMLSTLSELRVLSGGCSLKRYLATKLLLITIAPLSCIAVLVESFTRYDSYSNEYRAFPLYLFLCALPEAVRFFTAKPSQEEAHTADSPENDSNTEDDNQSAL
ncbi:MAG: hypothetical protein IJY39_10595 [Clostridia bacterium]|nr:hypothetical protein [Clostridia bacterium]